MLRPAITLGGSALGGAAVPTATLALATGHSVAGLGLGLAGALAYGVGLLGVRSAGSETFNVGFALGALGGLCSALIPSSQGMHGPELATYVASGLGLLGTVVLSDAIED